MKMQKHNSKEKLQLNHKASSRKKTSSIHTNGDIYDKKNLKRLLKHLRQMKKKKQFKKQKEFCTGKDTNEGKTDIQIKLRCHQLPNVVQEIRKAILRQDWEEVVTLLIILCHPGLKLYTSVILRTCCILLFNHLKSSRKLLQDFIRLITGYILEEDVNKFIKILFALRKSPVTIPEKGKHIRKTGDYKVARDFEFENL